jgi:hypothetical protein
LRCEQIDAPYRALVPFCFCDDALLLTRSFFNLKPETNFVTAYECGKAPASIPAESLRFFVVWRLLTVWTLNAGMSRPLLKFGGGSVEILRDVLH